VAVSPELKRRLGKIRDRVKESPFIVLIWGPGEGTRSPHHYQKRLKIREDLEKIVGEGNAVFSEDVASSEDTDSVIADLQQAGGLASEHAQVQAADAVILIPESSGSIAESALYLRELLGKTIVFTERREEEGFARQAYNILKVEEVGPEEWERCDRIRRKAREFVEGMRSLAFRLEKDIPD